jgi:hypothetical protein
MNNVQDYSVLYNNDVCPVICEGYKHLHGRIASLRGEGGPSLTTPPFIGVPVLSQESEQSCVCA